MKTHYRKPNSDGTPLCWEGEYRPEAIMTHPDIDKVTCEECKALYYFTGKELEVTKASLDLWLDGLHLGESAGWRQPVNLDFDRFLGNDRYAEVISDHITRSLANLAREIEEIGVKLAPDECAPE